MVPDLLNYFFTTEHTDYTETATICFVSFCIAIPQNYRILRAFSKSFGISTQSAQRTRSFAEKGNRMEKTAISSDLSASAFLNIFL
jgi:hypothetical protein